MEKSRKKILEQLFPDKFPLQSFEDVMKCLEVSFKTTERLLPPPDIESKRVNPVLF